MLARRLTTILPAMTLAEAIEILRLRCGVGRVGKPYGTGPRWSAGPSCCVRSAGHIRTWGGNMRAEALTRVSPG